MSDMAEHLVAVVTGAGRGLGRSYALALAREGAQVMVNDRDKEPAEEVAAEIRAGGGAASACYDSVADPEGAEAIVDAAVSAFGRIDVMVTNAGADRRGPVLDLSPDDWDFTLKTHLYGSIHCATAAGRAMVRQGSGGSIIIISSPAFYHPAVGLAPYCVAKGGTYALMKVLAAELAPVGIRVNALTPSATRTIPMLAYVDSLADQGVPSEVVESLRASVGEPEDVAPLVVYLASPASRQITGQAFSLTQDTFTLVSPPVESRTAYKVPAHWQPSDVAAVAPTMVAPA
jgi:NAD(P)-dependent dehydrogenase (short-subunit alcohol dehydrogenase family)